MPRHDGFARDRDQYRWKACRCSGATKIPIELFEVSDAHPSDEIASSWDALASLQPQFIPTFSDLLRASEEPGVTRRLLCVRDGERIVAIGAFLISSIKRQFWLGERPVLRLRVRAARLFGSASLGTADPAIAAAMLDRIAGDRGVDVVIIPHVPRTDFLCKAVEEGHWRGAASISHHRTTRRLAILPRTIDAYWASLRPSTRKAGLRDLKMFERLDPIYSVHTTPDEINDFLTRAVQLSATTYQLKLGVALVDTPMMRRHCERLGSEGRLRGYLVSVAGKDVAFAWGDISHGVMFFRTTGFDPAIRRHSPGKAIVLFALRDLIETKAAHTFDFSGRDMDFKERFSNTAIECADVVVARWRRPRGITVVGLERLFALAKKLAARLLNAQTTTKLRRIMRR